MQKRLFFLIALMLSLTLSIKAQITTSGLSGHVIADNEDVIGATIEAVHVPSGTRYVAVTNAKGQYTINGMRVGGPYKVTISYIGFQPKVTEGITLRLAEPYNLDANLNEDAKQLGEVVVSAKATKFTSEKTGASTNINNDAIKNMPTVTRSITDITRLSPYGGSGMSFAGSDGRNANFTVDGADFNNNFGLSSSLPGGGNPISIDAIQEMQVVISPYDVRQTNFIGGGVNAITKSGTNTFKGSAYIYHRNENMRGDAVYKQQIPSARETDRNTAYGFSLGGPILKDKLFFFVNGEMEKTPTVANRWRPSEDGVSDVAKYLSRTTIKDMQTVSDFVKQKYGYDTGSYTSFPADENTYRILARLDWNINDKHHAALRYNYTKSRGWNPTNASSMDGGSRSPYSRMGQYSMAFANSMYAIDHLVHSFSLDLNSRFTNDLSNQFLATFSKLDDVRYTNSSVFPFIDIRDGQKDVVGNYMTLGEELFTYNNAVHNNVWNIKDDLTWYKGDHKIMGGVNFEHQMADNQYMRNGTGYYRYYSLDDFLNGATPEVVALTYGYNGESSPAARINYSKVGIYAQDEWTVNPRLKLTYGLRLDDYFFANGDLMRNNAIYDVDYDGRHIDTGKWPGSNIIFSPRLGFSYDVLGDKRLKVRGGTGLFQGRVPLVFFTNMPTNSGMLQYNAAINEKTAKKMGFSMDEFKGGLVCDAQGRPTIDALKNKLISLGFPETISPEKGSLPSSISAVDPDFKMPQVWKTSVAVDYSVPVSFPFTLTAEYIYNKTLNAAIIKDWSVLDPDGFARFNGADSRHIYPSVSTDGNPHAYMLENTHKGYGWTFNLTATARPVDWINLMVAYTHTVTKELTSLPGSNAASVLNYMSTVEGPNNARLHNSQNVTPDRVVASVGFDLKHDHLNFIYEGFRGGYNYSFMTINDMNGDGFNYDALYIPTDAEVEKGMFRFISEDDKSRFMSFVHNNSQLKDHQGEYAEPYSLYNPWVHRVDLSYKHDFNVKIGETHNTLQVGFDMKNVLNFFNSKWGVLKSMNTKLGSDNPRLLKYEGQDAEGYATFSTNANINGDTPMFAPNYSISQCWNASISVRYIFN